MINLTQILTQRKSLPCTLRASARGQTSDFRVLKNCHAVDFSLQFLTFTCQVHHLIDLEEGEAITILFWVALTAKGEAARTHRNWGLPETKCPTIMT